jgi:hypothetical protein
MSITLGIYDLFGNMIPGLLYLYVINEALNKFNMSFIDIAQLNNTFHIVLVGVAAYILGHIFNPISYRGWYRIWFPKPPDITALTRIKKENPGVSLQFNRNDTKLLIGVIRHQNLEIAQRIETNQAGSILMRNISLGLALFVLVQIPTLFQNHFAPENIILVILPILLSYMAIKRAQKQDHWYHRDVFEDALNYGSSLDEVLRVSRQIVKSQIIKIENSKEPTIPFIQKPQKRGKDHSKKPNEDLF